MAGLGAGWGAYGGQFQMAPQTKIPKPPQPEPSQRMERGNFRNFRERGRGMDTGPSKPPVRMGGGINTGRTSMMGVIPSVGDPFRTYASVEGGRITPPANPYGQNQDIRFTPGGEYGGGPIQTGPSNPLQYMQGGGFTGGRMPQSDTAGATGYYNPPTAIPNMPPMNRPNRGALGQMYGGAGPSLGGGRFRGGLFY